MAFTSTCVRGLVPRATAALLGLGMVLVACNGADSPGGPVTEPIGPTGGSMTSSDGNLTLSVPAGALDAETAITIAPLAVAELPEAFRRAGATKAYELTPDGLEFDVPATATLRIGDGAHGSDGSASFPTGLLLTTGDGGEVVPLGGPSIMAGDDGAVHVSGTLEHFSPLVYTPTGLATELTVTGVPDEALAVDDTFEAAVEVAFDADASTVVDELADAHYHDRSDPPIACTTADCDDAPVPGDSESFTASFGYACSDPGAGRYGADVTLQATAGSDAFEVTLGVARFLDCDAGDDPPADEQARVAPLPGDGLPGAPVRVGYPFELFDVSVPAGAEPPTDLFAVLTADGTLRAFDETLVQRDTTFLGAEYAFASAAVSYTFAGEEGEERQDGLVLGGADGAVLLQRFGDIGSTTTITTGNATDAYGVGAYASYDLAETVATVDYSNGSLHVYGPDPESGSYAETDASGVIGNAVLGGQALISGWISPEGWDDAGDVAWMLTNPTPVDNTGNGWVWACVRTEDGTVGAECAQVAEVGRNPVRIRAAQPDGDGDTVVAVSSYDDQLVDLLRGNIYTGNMTRLDPLEDAQGVTPALTRDPENPDEVLVAAADRDDDVLVGARVHPDDTVEVKRIAAPPAGSDPDRPDAACRRPEHLSIYVEGSIAKLFGTCDGDESDPGVLFLIGYFGAFRGL